MYILPVGFNVPSVRWLVFFVRVLIQEGSLEIWFRACVIKCDQGVFESRLQRARSSISLIIAPRVCIVCKSVSALEGIVRQSVSALDGYIFP